MGLSPVAGFTNFWKKGIFQFLGAKLLNDTGILKLILRVRNVQVLSKPLNKSSISNLLLRLFCNNVLSLICKLGISLTFDQNPGIVDMDSVVTILEIFPSGTSLKLLHQIF